MADMDSTLGTAALLNGGLGGNNYLVWILLFFGFMLFSNGGFFGNGGANGGYATSSEVQRGFDNQNTVANQREALAAINSGTAQAVAATNQAKYDNINVAKDIQMALSTQINGVANMETSILDKVQSCCCETQRAIDGVNYNNAMNTSKILEALAQNKIEALQGQVNALQLQNAVAGVVRYPQSTVYTAGVPPFAPGIAPFTPFA
jgi:outer membrane cobalamin receptor